MREDNWSRMASSTEACTARAPQVPGRCPTGSPAPREKGIQLLTTPMFTLCDHVISIHYHVKNALG